MFQAVLDRLGIAEVNSGVGCGEWVREPSGPEIRSMNPATGELLARVITAGPADYEKVIAVAQAAFGEPFDELRLEPFRGEDGRRVQADPFQARQVGRLRPEFASGGDHEQPAQAVASRLQCPLGRFDEP